MFILRKILDELKAFDSLKKMKVSFVYIPVSVFMCIAGYYIVKIYNNVEKIPSIEQRVISNSQSIVTLDSTLVKTKDLQGLATKEDVQNIKGYVDGSFNEAMQATQYSFKHYSEQNRNLIIEYLQQQEREGLKEFGQVQGPLKKAEGQWARK